jgi:hypothetical protein
MCNNICAWAGCINQDSKAPAEQLNGSLARIIGACDMVVTPIHDPNWRSWSLVTADFSVEAAGPDEMSIKVTQVNDVFAEYLAEAFRVYLSRGWCRLEMFLSANIPIGTRREKLFGGKLRQVMLEEKRRPHLVFGTREKELGVMPLILQALKHEQFEVLHPAEVFLCDKRDAVIIDVYVEELFRINKKLRVSYFSCVCFSV